MKKMIAITLLCLCWASLSLAEDVKVLPAKIGDVKFTHEKHKELQKGCQPCHPGSQGGKIEGFNKEKAHKLCQECHSAKQQGPTKCGECHKKG